MLRIILTFNHLYTSTRFASVSDAMRRIIGRTGRNFGAGAVDTNIFKAMFRIIGWTTGYLHTTARNTTYIFKAMGGVIRWAGYGRNLRTNPVNTGVFYATIGIILRTGRKFNTMTISIT